MNPYIIETKNLSYSYSKAQKAIDNLSIKVPKGSIYGFLGPNGAGKSTTMRLLTGLIPDDSDSIEIFGKPLNIQFPEIFTKMGCLVESPALYLHLTGKENLKYIAAIRGIGEKRIQEILEIVELSEHQNRKTKRYSLGMKQRLAIGMALLGNPELLLLDEPVNGLDPKGIKDIRNLLIKVNKEYNTSIFISSHLLSEIEKLCSHVGIITNGKLRFQGDMQELSKNFDQCRIKIRLRNPQDILIKISSFQPRLKPDESALEVSLAGKENIPDFVQKVVQAGGEIYEIEILEGIEEWFMSLTK